MSGTDESERSRALRSTQGETSETGVVDGRQEGVERPQGWVIVDRASIDGCRKRSNVCPISEVSESTQMAYRSSRCPSSCLATGRCCFGTGKPRGMIYGLDFEVSFKIKYINSTFIQKAP